MDTVNDDLRIIEWHGIFRRQRLQNNKANSIVALRHQRDGSFGILWHRINLLKIPWDTYHGLRY